ncbi:hypothetical protein [Actinoplanes sp. NPDC089786]|uniref:hypothetical protein n=1 Tax=Actinoplanes sp. NPDC089786 TaxID=3155185 RepID=UPI00344970B4
MRLFLAMAAGIVALLCLGGVGVFVSLYDDATKIKRTEPDAVVDSYLRAYLVNRDPGETSLFTCSSGGDFTQIEAFRGQIESTEKQYTVGVRVSWTSLEVTAVNGQTTVSTDVIRTLTDNSERDTQRWSFTMVDQDGWRVCKASQLA